MLIVLALAAAVVIGGLVALTAGVGLGIAVAGLLVVAGIVAQRSEETPRRAIGITLLVALLTVGSYGALLTFELLEALNTTDLAADPADAAQLGSAEGKLDGLDSAFRIELTEPELQAVIQDGLAASDGVPIRRIDLDFRGSTGDLGFVASFKAGRLQATGDATVSAVDGGIDLALGALEFGSLRVPGIAAEAVQSLLGAITDLNAALAEQQAIVQGVQITDDLMIVTGVRATSDVLTSGDLLAAIRAQASVAIDAVQAPPERIGRGTAASLDEPGAPIVLALGDSLAANVGVDDVRDGFVSRVHGHLSRADGAAYGLVNLAVPGETSTTLRAGGQLQSAELLLATRPAAYVVLDVGGNDLLGHLQSQDCSEDLASAGCQQRVEQTLTAYRANIAEILSRITTAAGQARVVVLTTYNPFSLGLGDSQQERESSAIVSRLNAVAVDEAARAGVTVADGFSPMQGTTAATTHMLDPEPDVHPNAAGHDVLAAAVVDAL